MGIRTDLTSLGAIGLGTAVAVIGTGAVLLAAVSQAPDATPDRSACLAIAAAPAAPARSAVDAPEAPPAPEAPRVVAAISIGSTPDVPEPDLPTAGDVRPADAPVPPDVRGVRIVVSDRIEVRTECVVERIRAEARQTGEVDAVHVRELVDAALADAGVRR